MSVILRLVVLAGLLLAAIGCYVFGVPAGGVAFLVLGFVLEGLFWFGVIGKNKNSS